MFNLYGNITITAEGLKNLGLCSKLRAFEHRGIFIVPHLLWHGASVFLVSYENHLVTGREKMQRTRPGLEPKIPEFLVRCSSQWAIWPPAIEPGWLLHSSLHKCFHTWRHQPRILCPWQDFELQVQWWSTAPNVTGREKMQRTRPGFEPRTPEFLPTELSGYRRSNPADRYNLIQSLLTTHKGRWRTNSCPDPHSVASSDTREYGGPVLIFISMGHHLVAFYDT
jgi:hypothetical protein